MDHLDAAKGSTIDLERVLLIAEGDKMVVGNPLVAGARVTATSQGEHKGEKIIVFKIQGKEALLVRQDSHPRSI